MHADLIALAEAARETLLQTTDMLSAELPLKFLRQQAQYTTPASNFKLANGAAGSGFAPTMRILGKYDIGVADLAETLAVDAATIEALLDSDPHAPLVMIDGEDAQALNEETVQIGRKNAVKVFHEADWGPTLRFYRPSGLNLPYGAGDLVTVLTQAAEGLDSAENYPIDGIIFPKIEHAAEVEWVFDLLSNIEQRIGLPQNQIKFQFLVESGWSVANLAAIARAALPRLTGIIFGIADYSADLALPDIRYDHPVCDWARAHVVNMAGAVGVPAIDAMTVNYPVASRQLTNAQNRRHILDRLKECYDDTLHSIALGMSGKWVGHPAQLFVVLLAYRVALSTGTMQAELDKILTYEQAVQANIGATIIDGVMSDRATDRHARARLRQGVALGLISAEQAQRLGIITAQETDTVG
ncbi:MAG: aldolase/citrate lyase family protein [Anaerolineae bacterium]|nr:aldolase/citrate lyase family protein [Anaerolineae bacterium]